MQNPLSKIKNEHLKRTCVYLLVTLFLLVFGYVYELFGYGVYSAFMVFAFTVPLVFGVLVCLLLWAFKAHVPSPVSAAVYRSGIVTLALGSVLKGVLDISGYTNRMMPVYLIAGVLLIIAGIVLFFTSKERNA